MVCAKFPPNYAVVKVKGKERPRDPSSIFDGISKSLLPSLLLPKKRTTTKVGSAARGL